MDPYVAPSKIDGLDRPGPQAINAGLTRQFESTLPVLEERVRKLEFALDNMRNWAKASNERYDKLEAIVEEQRATIRRLEDEGSAP